MNSLPTPRLFALAAEEIQSLLLEMAVRAEEQVRDATAALSRCDPELATVVILADDALNAMQLRIDEACMMLLARQQPVAADLRLVVAAMRIAKELERIGDHATNVAHAVRDLAARPQTGLAHLEEMGHLAGAMLTSALDHLVRGDSERASLLWRLDERVDALLQCLTGELVAAMTRDPGDIAPGMVLLRAGRNLERVADLATNIAEDVVFVVEGRRFRRGRETVRHGCAEGVLPRLHLEP